MKPLLLIAPATSYRVPAFVAAARRLGVPIAIGSDVPAAHEAHGVPVFRDDIYGRDHRVVKAMPKP